MKWFKEHQKATALLALLLILALVIVFSYTTKDSATPIGRVLQSGLTFIEEPIAIATDRVSNGFFGIFNFRTIQKENEALRQEVNDLKQELIREKLSALDLAELKKLSEQLNDQGKLQQYYPVTSDVIAFNGSEWFHVFTINAGTKEGIIRNATVINGNGLVGKIIETAPGWSKVVSIIDESNQVSFRVLRDPNLIGICSGDGIGSLAGYMLNAEAAVVEGDTLITTGIGLYPEGFVIGEVKEVIWDKDLLVKRVKIEPSVRFNSIRKVSVILPK